MDWFTQAARTLVLTVDALIAFGIVLGLLADYSAVAPIFGVTGIVGLIFLCLSGVITYRDLKVPQADRGRWTTMVALTLFVVGAVAVFPGARTLLENGPAKVGSAAPSSGQPQPSASPSTTTTPPPTGTPVPANSDCPRPDPTDPALPSVDLQVVYWCKGGVLGEGGAVDPHNYQIKVRPRLVNNTTERVRIEITDPSAIRLLVTGKQIDERWTPPPHTARGGDKPILVKCDGGTFWAIPPNLPHDATVVGTYYSGFATTWDGTTLGAGQSYYKPLRHRTDGRPVQESDLVFQVPLDDNGSARIYGLAVLDTGPTGAILGLAPYSAWPPAMDPTAF